MNPATHAEPPGHPSDEPAAMTRATSVNLQDVMHCAIALAEGMGEGFSASADRLLGLQQRLEQGQFNLAVLGQFKRGKSTLLNALLGEAVLPTSIVPLTAIPTFIRSGPNRHITVKYLDDRQSEQHTAGSAAELEALLSRFVAEDANPKNRLGVSQVDVLHPAPILRKGVVLIDTPGIGSTFRHNTEATLNFLPQCDAALFLVSADPPITEVEVAFLKEVRTKVPRLFFILNKVDYLSEQERQTAVEFLKKVLVEQVGIQVAAPVFCVSARTGLAARRDADASRWQQSGLAEVESHLIGFLAFEKASALAEALGLKVLEILAAMQMRLQLAIRSLQMPLSELEQRLGVFDRKLEEAARQRQDAADLLAGDRKRTIEFLEGQAESLRGKARTHLHGVIEEALTKGREPSEEAVRTELAAAVPGFFEHELGEMSRRFDVRVTGVLSPHQRRADDLIESVRKTAAELFDVPYRAPESTGMFKLGAQPYWVTHKWSATLSPIPDEIIDRLMPRGIKLRRIRNRLAEQAEKLVIHNVEDLRWSTLQSLETAFRQFGSGLDERLADTIAATRGAIRAALAKRQERSQSVAADVERLGKAVDELQQLQAILGRS